MFWAFDRRCNSNIDGDISISKFDLFCDLVTSSMTSWICIHIIVVIRKFNDDIFARCLVIMKKMLLFHLYRNIEGRLWGHPVTSSMTSSSWKYFFLHNLGRSYHIWGQIEAVLNISKFSKWPLFWARDKLFTGSYTGSWIDQKDSHEHFQHFELLIDALAQILTEIYHFQNLTYFVTWWRHRWCHECVKHNLHN